MTTYIIENTTSGHVIGDFDGETSEHAIAAMLRDAGYRAEVVDGEIDTDCPNWNGGTDLAATERAAYTSPVGTHADIDEARAAARKHAEDTMDDAVVTNARGERVAWFRWNTDRSMGDVGIVELNT